MEIVNFFYELAREHNLIKGFRYGKSYSKGAGNDVYPLMWLDDPILGTRVTQSVIRYTVNVDILGIPVNEKASVVEVQGAALDVGLSIVEKILRIRNNTQISTDTFNFISLRNYYDDNAAGQRFTFQLLAPNPANRCVDNFDPNKQFPTIDSLPSFSTDNPDGCAVFSDATGLPNFNLNI